MTDHATNISAQVTWQNPGQTRAWVAPVTMIFIFCLIIPGNFTLPGNLSVNASRLVMMLAIIPLTIAWISGKAGRIVLPDVLILLHAAWMMLSYIYNHGLERLPYASITGIELFGGYLMGRILIRTPDDFRRFFRYMIIAFIVILPFAIYEMRTGVALLQHLSRAIFGISHADAEYGRRMGIYRSQGMMQHPILFGLFFSLAVANIFYIWRDQIARGLSGSGLALFLTFSSMSSGPLLAGVSQLLMIVWGQLTKEAWAKLAIFSVAAYIFLSFASNRGPVVLMIETLTFNSNTGWTRVYIYRHGIQNVWANPIFGLGLHDWVRPGWLTGSVDNFWLITAMRHGVVGFVLLAGGLLLALVQILRAHSLSDTARRYRTGYVVALVAMSFTLSTVHVWGPTYVLTLFYFGAGAWFYVQAPASLAGPEAAAVATAPETAGPHALRYRRGGGTAAATDRPRDDLPLSRPSMDILPRQQRQKAAPPRATNAFRRAPTHTAQRKPET